MRSRSRSKHVRNGSGCLVVDAFAGTECLGGERRQLLGIGLLAGLADERATVARAGPRIGVRPAPRRRRQ